MYGNILRNLGKMEFDRTPGYEPPRPEDLFDVYVPDETEVYNVIRSGRLQKVDPETIKDLGLLLKTMYLNLRNSRLRGEIPTPHLFLPMMDADMESLLVELWGPQYIERIRVTQIVTQKGKELILYTYNALSDLYHQRTSPDRAFERTLPRRIVRAPSARTIRKALERIRVELVTLEQLEEMYESLSVLLKEAFRGPQGGRVVNLADVDVDLQQLRNLIMQNQLFFDFLWGTDYVDQVLLETVSRLDHRRVLRDTLSELERRMTALRGQGPRSDEALRLRVQVYVAERTLMELKRVAQKFGQEYGFTGPRKSGLDLPVRITATGASSETWRDRMTAILRPPSVGELAAYQRIRGNEFVDTQLIGYPPVQRATGALDWPTVFRGLVRQEFTVPGWATHASWIALAEELEQLKDQRTLGTVSITLGHIISEARRGRFPKSYVLTDADRSVIARADAYARRRAQYAQQGTVQRSGRLANLSALRDLRNQSVARMVDFLHDMGKGIRGADIGLPERYVTMIQRVVERTDKLYRRVIPRTIQCSIGQSIEGACAQDARGQCKVCAAPLCGTRACTVRHTQGGGCC